MSASGPTESVYRQIGRSTGIYSVAIIASKAASLFLLPIYTRFLTPADYGLIELLELTSFIFSALIGMRIGDSLFFYYSSAADQQERERAVCTVFLGSALLGISGALLGCLAAPLVSRVALGSAEYAPYLQLMFVTFAFSLPVETGFCYMRALNRPGAYVAASIMRLALGITLNVALLWAGLKVSAVLFSSLAVTAVMAVYMGVFSLSGIAWRQRFDPGLMRKFIRYSAPLGFSGLAMFVINYGDRFFLQRHVSLAEIGVYSLAYKLGMLITYIQMPFDVYWRSQMFSIVRSSDGAKVYVRVATYLMLVLTSVVVLFALFIDPVIRVLTPSEFWTAAQYVPWLAAAYLIRTVGAHFRCVFLLESRTEVELQITAAGAGTCLVSYAFLIPRFGLAGAVASTLLGFSVMLLLGFWRAQKQRPFPFEYSRMAILAGAAVAVVSIFHAVRPASMWAHTGVAFALALAYPALLFLLRFPQADEFSALRRSAAALAAKLRALWRTPAAAPGAVGRGQ